MDIDLSEFLGFENLKFFCEEYINMSYKVWHR